MTPTVTTSREPSPAEAVVVLCTCPDGAVARRLAGGLVEAGLAACVNVLPAIRSIYRWEGEVQDDEEVLMIVKTRGAAYPELEAWLLEHHPYEVPEVLALPIRQGSPAYLEWLNAETQRG